MGAMARRSFPILFITATRIGDAVLSSGLIRKLYEEAPGARFTIAAGPAAAPLFLDTPNLDDLIVMRKSPAGGHWFDLWRRTRARRWGLVVDMRGSAISGFLKRSRRAVYRRPEGDVVHKVIEAAGVLGLSPAEAPAPYLFTSAQTQALAAEVTAGGGPILALSPAANWVGKTWPAERFAQAAIQLLREPALAGGRLMVLGGPEDRGVVSALRNIVPRERMIDLVGKVPLLTAYACLQRARLFIGNDSGLMHLASAAGAPTLGLFGPSDDRRYAPWGPLGAVVRTPRSLDEIRAVDPDLNQAVCHMMDLNVRTVVQAARQLLIETEEA